MPDTTTKGAPFPEGSDPPNAPGQIQALAEWVDGILTGTDQQQLTADSLQPSRTRFRFPRARTDPPTPSGDRGDLWCPTSGPNADQLHMHDGDAWRRVGPSPAAFDALPRGLVARASMTDLVTVTSITDIVTVTFTGIAGRAYEIRAGGVLRAAGRLEATPPSAATEPVHAAGVITRSDNTEIGTWAMWTSPPNPPTIALSESLQSGQTGRLAFTGSTTVKARLQRLSPTGTLSAIGTMPGGVWIAVYDVGLMP